MKFNARWMLAAGIGVLSFAAAAARAENRIESVIVTESDNGQSALVVIESAEPLKYHIAPVAYPPQVQIVIDEPVACGDEPLRRVDKKLVQGVQSVCASASPAAEPRPQLKMITILLNHKCTFTANQNDWVLSLTLKRSADSSEPGRSASPRMPAPVYAPGSASYLSDDTAIPASSLSNSPDLQEIIQVGLANHKPLEIAQKELKLARRRLFEARRNFFPSLAARGSQTEGTTITDPDDPRTTADFRRKEIGMEVGLPVFQGGRLYYAEKQAKAQKEIAELEVGRLAQDVTFEIIRAAYAFVVAREAVTVRRSLQGETERVLETTLKKKEIGVASETEYLGVLSAAKQVEYKALSQEKDLEIAKTRLLAALNLNHLPEDVRVGLETSLAGTPSRTLDLNGLLAMAAANRPEMKIAAKNRQAKEYARKVARGEYLFRVDASGFVGQSGAAFMSEDLAMKDSYNFGLKGTLYFGGSSVSPALVRDKSAPDLGSTSRTNTRSESLTIGILDSLAAGSNLMQTKIDEEKAAEELRKAQRDVQLEVKEAFFNYQKAKFQMESAKNELEYRQKESEVAKAKDKLHQLEGTQFIQALGSLTEAQIALKEATSFYLISLAALEKAIGSKLPDRM